VPSLQLLPIDGVRLRPLETRPDRRGCLTEAFRQHWDLAPRPVQWNVVQSTAGVLRGVHAFACHGAYLLVLSGRASVGLCDLRAESPSYGTSCLVPLEGDSPAALEIPPGVAHGLYFADASLHLCAVSHYLETADELGCRWDDPALGIPWPAVRPVLSARDEELGTLAELVQELRGAPRAAA
jgi:dTDP-4-dehydrorhamnose 3,5-epimerase